MTDLLIIFLAKYLYIASVAAFLYYALTAEDTKRFWKYAIIVGALSLALSLVAAALYYNPRPFMLEGAPTPLVAHAPGNGFPSDHALLTGTIAAIITAYSLPLGAALWLVALLVSVGRVLAGVHHTVDIIASFGIAALSAALVYYGTRYARPGK